jgi:hypothetical protein
MKDFWRRPLAQVGFVVLCLISNTNSNAETGTALKADTLRAQPYNDAKSNGTLSKNDALEILAKKGAWLQVKTKHSTGWVRILSVRRTSSTNNNAIKGAMDVASGRAGTGNVVSTTGIRGLSAEELKSAQFNEAEMKKMESHAVSQDTAKQFAASGGLKSTNIAYLKGAK